LPLTAVKDTGEKKDKREHVRAELGRSKERGRDAFRVEKSRLRGGGRHEL